LSKLDGELDRGHGTDQAPDHTTCHRLESVIATLRQLPNASHRSPLRRRVYPAVESSSMPLPWSQLYRWRLRPSKFHLHPSLRRAQPTPFRLRTRRPLLLNVSLLLDALAVESTPTVEATTFQIPFTPFPPTSAVDPGLDASLLLDALTVESTPTVEVTALRIAFLPFHSTSATNQPGFDSKFDAS
jgi:hypothetical protein